MVLGGTVMVLQKRDSLEVQSIRGPCFLCSKSTKFKNSRLRVEKLQHVPLKGSSLRVTQPLCIKYADVRLLAGTANNTHRHGGPPEPLFALQSYFLL